MSTGRTHMQQLGIGLMIPLGLLGLVVVFMLIGAVWALFGIILTPYDPTVIDLTARLERPSLAHPFGTDGLGRDLFSRVVVGSWFSLATSLVVVALAASVGSAIGAIAALFGGVVESLLMRLTDLFLAFPALILAAAISASLGGNLYTTAAALAAVFWPWYARLARARVLALRRLDYVTAARALGAGRFYLLSVTLPPVVLPTIVVQMTMDVALVTLSIASFSFLGLGAQPPTPEWGALIYDALPSLPGSWWLAAFPGLVLALAALSFNLCGDAARDSLDPNLLGDD